MPEGPEIEAEKLHEQIVEELEKEGGHLLKKIALSTALLAVVGAVAALEAGSTVNEALMLRTDASRLQAEASDQWAFYQAKGLKAAVQEADRNAWLAAGKEPSPDFAVKAKRYVDEQAEIEKAAHEKERDRDEKVAESDHLLHRHHRFAAAVALLQVCIALAAVSALTRQKWIWIGSLMLGVVGIGMFLVTYFGG
jgi:lipopolysaccharide export LptBFGC system permease protein LptF